MNLDSDEAQLLQGVLAQLRAQPESLAATLAQAGAPLIAFDLNRTIIAANPAAERFFGYGRGGLEGRSTDDLLPLRLRQPGAPPPAIIDEPTTVGLPALRSDGSEVQVLWTFGSTTPSRGGTCFVLTAKDRDASITDAARAQFELLVDTLPVLAWYADPDGSVPWFNRRWFEYTGTTLQDQAGWGWTSVCDPTDLARILGKWKAAVASGQPWEDEFRIRREDGVYRWFLSRAVPLESPSRRIVRWFGTSVDIDDQRRAGDRKEFDAQAELTASEAAFHRLVDAISDYAIFMLDPQGKIASWNRGAAKIKGYQDSEIIGQHFSVFYTPSDRQAGKPEAILQTVRREGRYEEEGWRVRKGGSTFWASVVITALRDKGGAITGFAKVTRDLTDKREAEEQGRELIREQLARADSERAWKELERINRAKDDFLATMSHELRTPLNAIYGWATLLRRKPREEDKLDRGLEAIERNAKTQTRLINDLLDVSRIITGKLRLSLIRVDVYPLMVAVVDVVRPAADAKGVRLVLDIDPGIGATLADPDRLQQVFWNLLTNAIRFTPRGGKVTLTGDRNGSALVLSILDTGAGIASPDLPHLFERFMQVDSSMTRTHGGLGLGLSIVRHLVEGHGGTVEAASPGLGSGATFTVRLPIRAVRQEPSLSTPGASEVSGPHAALSTGAIASIRESLRGLRILLVEDDPDSMEVLCAVLDPTGAEVVSAMNAREALRALEAAAPFDLIISDIGMPEVDGFALMRQIRSGRAAPSVPAIALTAYARTEDVERAKSAGFQQHLSKPVEEADLLAAVETWSRRSVEARPPS